MWPQVITIVVSIFGVFLWSRRETNTDSKELRAMILTLGAKMDGKFDKLIEEMHKETKDFHGRLCKLEEKYAQIRKD